MKFNGLFQKLDHLTCRPSGIPGLKPIEVNGFIEERQLSQFSTSEEGIQNNRALNDKFFKFDTAWAVCFQNPSQTKWA